MCLRSLLCFSFDVLDASVQVCFIQVMLRLALVSTCRQSELNRRKTRRTKQSRCNTRGNESNIVNKRNVNTRLDTKVWRNITWMKHMEASNTLKGKQSIFLKHTLYTLWWPTFLWYDTDNKENDAFNNSLSWLLFVAAGTCLLRRCLATIRGDLLYQAVA
jgi:hypothetical protein